MREPWPEHEPISKFNQYGREMVRDLSGESTRIKKMIMKDATSNIMIIDVRCEY